MKMVAFTLFHFCWRITYFLYAEKLIWTSQIEGNESSCFCFPVVPIDGNLYIGLSHMLLRNATSTCLQFTFQGPKKPWLQISLDLKIKVINFLNLCHICILSLWYTFKSFCWDASFLDPSHVSVCLVQVQTNQWCWGLFTSSSWSTMGRWTT